MAPRRDPDARPEIALEDGSRLPIRLRIAHAALRSAPPGLHRQLTRVFWRTLGFRLPGLRASYEDGRRFHVPAKDAMYAQVFANGGYELAESRALAALLRPGDFALDIGANHGWYSLLMASAVGDGGRVWAFEPVPPMLAELRANLELNPGAPIDVKPIALGEEAGTVTIHVFEGLVHGHASMSTLGRDDFTAHEAPIEPLDDVLADAPGAPALVKLDVEGAERAVLRGATDLIRSPEAPIWMIEVNEETSEAFGYAPSALVGELSALGPHDVFRVADGRLEPEPDPAEAPHGATWIAVPENRRDRVEGLVGSTT